jgi:undecaprenyl-diphosphatase
MAGWDNPDVDLLYDVNGLAERAPTWADHTMEYVGEYGTVFAVMLLGLWSWWTVRRRSPDRATAIGATAGLIWAPLAAVVALIVNIPIRHLVQRPRPFLDHKGLEVLVRGKSDYSFVSDHATLTMAVAVGIFMVSRRYGLISIAVAVFAAFSRVYMGVHYPTDVIGGLALGTAVALLLAPLALWLLTPLVRAVAGSPRVGALVWSGAAGPGPEGADGEAPEREPAGTGARGSYRRGGHRARDRDLAA